MTQTDTWTESQLPDAAVACNCARCGALLVSGGIDESKRGTLEKPAGRVYGRPYCWRCIDRARREPLPPEHRFAIPDPE